MKMQKTLTIKLIGRKKRSLNRKKEPHKNAYAGLKCLRCARQLATITPDIALLIFFALSLSRAARKMIFVIDIPETVLLARIQHAVN